MTAKRQLLMPTLKSATAGGVYSRSDYSSSSSSSSSSSRRALQAANQQQRQQPSMPDVLLARGYKGLAPAVLRNWRRLADKLNTPGSNVTVVAFGGSITAGYIDAAPNSSWVDPLMASLRARNPAASFSLVNLARGGHDVQAAATCWYQLAPQDADLILVEYSVNGCNGNMWCHSFMAPKIAAYETFLRRMIRRAPGAALLAVAAFDFTSMGLSLRDSWGPPTASNMTRLRPYYNSGEVFHTRIAHRYGIPMASIRDALYDVFYDDQLLLAVTGMTKEQLLSPAAMIHPSAAGHVLFAKVIWYTLQLTLSNVMAATRGAPRSPQQQQLPVPAPISPKAAAEAGVDPFCAEAVHLEQYATNSSGWSWGEGPHGLPCPHPNCIAWGFSATGAGKTLEFTIDTQNSTSGAALQRRSLLGIFQTSRTADWLSKTGSAQLSCVSGCSCRPAQMKFESSASRSIGENSWGNLGVASTEVRL
uniref:SGNH hydrolase-type esterase domain-containing protein n=1 Tax=Tetradesmus obliquus TaxID=3088 RepID=A0A383WFL8_TETOB|eukprot:jgi/Sobl393_1/19341/SZX76063.1